MSTFKHPVGSRPPGVYWRRRLVVALVLLAIIIVIVLVVARPGSHHEPVPTPTPTSQTEVTPSAQPNASSAVAACAASNVKVQAITDQAAYAPTQIPQLSMSVTNVGSQPCSLDVGTAKQVFTISSGSDTYWTSTDCQSGATDQVMDLKPGKTISSQTPIVWNRNRSSPSTCNSTPSQVPAAGASYHLSVQVGGITSQNSKQFILE